MCVATSFDCASGTASAPSTGTLCGELGLLECTPGIPINAYRCTCQPGYADGFCQYGVLAAYVAECDVSIGGNCTMDVDECSSTPCQNNATCIESSSGLGGVPPDMYVCVCAAGWSGENCGVDVDECASAPCQNGATCVESSVASTVAVDSYTCLCSAGWTGGNCTVDVDECASAPCQNLSLIHI